MGVEPNKQSDISLLPSYVQKYMHGNIFKRVNSKSLLAKVSVADAFENQTRGVIG